MDKKRTAAYQKKEMLEWLLFINSSELFIQENTGLSKYGLSHCPALRKYHEILPQILQYFLI
jgi:hypothetical protein